MQGLKITIQRLDSLLSFGNYLLSGKVSVASVLEAFCIYFSLKGIQTESLYI